jgi:hypothetical protein
VPYASGNGPAGESATAKLTLGPGLQISRGNESARVTNQGMLILNALHRALQHTVSIPQLMTRRTGAIWREHYQGSNSPKGKQQRETIQAAIRRLRESLAPLFMDVELEGDDIMMRLRPFSR